MSTGRIFVLYYDDILSKILERSTRGLMSASRGKDIPKNHVSDNRDRAFRIPYATKGRSVKRYAFDRDYLTHTDEWFRGDETLVDSYSNRFLLATKNYPYPRCLMKPEGVIHGGGAVRIELADHSMNPEALGAILNSRIMRYICRRYLTNYSQLTTCMNTGIFEEMPIAYPKKDRPLVLLFRGLSELHTKRTLNADELETKMYLEHVTDAITYSLYLGDEQDLLQAVNNVLDNNEGVAKARQLYEALDRDSVRKQVLIALEKPTVKRIESSPFMSTDESPRRC